MYNVSHNYSWRLTAISIFLHFLFGLGVALVKEKWHLANPLASSCRYKSVCENICNGSRVMPTFAYWPRIGGWKDGRTHKSIIQHIMKVDISRTIDFSAGRAINNAWRIIQWYFVGILVCRGVESFRFPVRPFVRTYVRLPICSVSGYLRQTLMMD